LLIANCPAAFAAEIFPVIQQLPAVKRLDVSGYGLPNIPSFIFEPTFVQVTHLNFSYNKLREIPYGIRNLRNLVRLDLSNNKLTKLPFSIGKSDSGGKEEREREREKEKERNQEKEGLGSLRWKGREEDRSEGERRPRGDL
jgi:Leucine-rich repeat (LRR) protein